MREAQASCKDISDLSFSDVVSSNDLLYFASIICRYLMSVGRATSFFKILSLYSMLAPLYSVLLCFNLHVFFSSVSFSVTVFFNFAAPQKLLFQCLLLYLLNISCCLLFKVHKRRV